MTAFSYYDRFPRWGSPFWSPSGPEPRNHPDWCCWNCKRCWPAGTWACICGTELPAPGTFTVAPIRWRDDEPGDTIAEVYVGFSRPGELDRERGVRFTSHAGSVALKRALVAAMRRDPGLRLDIAEVIVSRAQLHALARWSAQ